MQDKFVAAGQGLKLLFIAVIIQLVGGVLAFVPVLGAVVSVVGSAAGLYGLYTAMSAHENYKLALYMEAAALVVSILGAIFTDGLLGGVVDILSLVVTFLVTYFVCTASAAVLTDKGDMAQASRATLIWKLYLVCSAVNILCVLISWIPLINLLGAALGVITAIVQAVASILLFIFYYNASRSLLA